jgi:phage terminase large subunit-like protein
MRQVVEANPLVTTHPISEAQRELLSAWTRFVLFCGGNRAGKSFGGILKDLIELLPREVLPEHLQAFKHLEPPVRGRIVSPGRSTTQEVVIFDLLRQMAPKAGLVGGSFDSAYDKQHNMLHFEGGSWLQFLTAEMDVDKHAGAALDFVHFDEEPTGDKGLRVYRENVMRILSTDGHFWMTMTPTEGFSWSMGELYDNSHLPHVTVIRSSMHDNPTVSEDAKRDALQGLTEEEREARVEGRYVHFGGLVYPEFGGKHLVPEPELAHIKHLDVIVGIDPGLTGTGVVWIGFDKDDHALAFDELFLKDATPDVVAPGIREVNARWGLEPDHYVIDPSARNRDLINAEQLEAAYARAGIYTMPGQNAREPGITQVKRRLQSDPPALLVSEGCQRLRWEFARYRRQEKPDGSFDVLKRDDHLCFVAGTMIATERGQRPIESVRVGDRVWTRKGLKRVVEAGLTGEEWVVHMTAGRANLVGTPGHPVYVRGVGWTRLDSVRHGDSLWAWDGSTFETLTGSDSVATRTQAIERQGSTSSPVLRIAKRALRFFIARSGKPRMDRYPMGTTYTTGTAIPSITTWATSSASAPSSTHRNIGPSSVLRRQEDTPMRFGRWRWLGIGRRKDGRGTSNMVVWSGPAVSGRTSLANNVVVGSNPLWTTLGFVPTPASRRGVGTKVSMRLTSFALRVARQLGAADTRKPKLAAVSAAGVCGDNDAPREVFNLTVEDAHEFFANGVLVHNCDALRYCLMERAWGVMEDYQPPKRKAHWNPTTGHVPAFKDVPADDFEIIESAGPMGRWA